jgi:hypothetical protein
MPLALMGDVWEDRCAYTGQVAGQPLPPNSGCVAGLGRIYHGNGERDLGEAALRGVTLRLVSGQCPVRGEVSVPAGAPTRVTDANGHYLFEGLAAGTYCLVIDPRVSPATGPGTPTPTPPPPLAGIWTTPASLRLQTMPARYTVVLAAATPQLTLNFAWDPQ